MVQNACVVSNEAQQGLKGGVSFQTKMILNKTRVVEGKT